MRTSVMIVTTIAPNVSQCLIRSSLQGAAHAFCVSRRRRSASMRHPLLIVLLATALAAGCAKKDQPAETGTMGNATDRNPANGTSGTGEPASVATDATNAAQQLGTAAPSKATGTLAITGTEEVHGASTATTSTIAAPGTTTEAVMTPTATTATIALGRARTSPRRPCAPSSASRARRAPLPSATR